jgi:hypothetical protein
MLGSRYKGGMSNTIAIPAEADAGFNSFETARI